MEALKNSEIIEKWYLLDASNQKIGRLATKVATLLLGKNDAKLAPAKHLAPKNHVVVINASQLFIAEKKQEQKLYTQYSGFPGGLKTTKLADLFAKFPERVIEHAVKGMLPKNRRGNKIYTNLHVYAGADHKHEANKPQLIN